MSPPLRLAILLESLTMPCWQAEMLAKIQRSQYAQIELVVLNATPETPAVPMWQKFYQHWPDIPSALARRGLEFIHQQFVEGRRFLPDAFTMIDCRSEFAGIRQLKIAPRTKKFSDYVTPEDLEQIRAIEPDVILRLGFRILRGDILHAARYGVWSLHHGDNRVNRGGPAGFWESMESWPATGAVLQVLNEDLDNGQVLARTNSCTNIGSVRDNRSNYFWKALNLIPRKLEQLHRIGPTDFFAAAAAENQHPPLYSRRLFAPPTNIELASLLVRKVWEKCRIKTRSLLTYDQWGLYYDLRDGLSSSFWRYRPITPPPDRIWADPHVIEQDGIYHVFLEEFIAARGKGHIAHMTIDRQGRCTKPRAILQRDYHLSYPLVFAADGELYMVPETGANRTIELYRCRQFPDQWEHQMNLFENIHAVDATLHYQDGLWWLFANIIETPGASSWDETFLFYAPDFRTRKWQAHPQNPIASDASSSRSAGALFTHQGRLYRPTQNCTGHYGYGFNLAQVLQLTPQHYAEEVVCRVTPDWRHDIVSTHTFSHAGRLSIIDAQRRRWRWA